MIKKLIYLVFLLIVIILILGIYIVYDKLLNDSKQIENDIVISAEEMLKIEKVLRLFMTIKILLMHIVVVIEIGLMR